MKEKFLIAIGATVIFAFILAFAAFISGTILYFIWPVAIPVVFPTLISSGVLPAKLSWWVAVCLTWVFSILIKSTQINNNK